MGMKVTSISVSTTSVCMDERSIGVRSPAVDMVEATISVRTTPGGMG